MKQFRLLPVLAIVSGCAAIAPGQTSQLVTAINGAIPPCGPAVSPGTVCVTEAATSAAMASPFTSSPPKPAPTNSVAPTFAPSTFPVTPTLGPATSAPSTQNIVGSNVGNTIIQQKQTIIQQTVIQQNIVAAPIPTPVPQVPWVTFTDAEFSIQYPSNITNVTPIPSQAALGVRFAIYGKGAAIAVRVANFAGTLDDAFQTYSTALTVTSKSSSNLGGSPAILMRGVHSSTGTGDSSFNVVDMISVYGSKVFQITYYEDSSVPSDVSSANTSLFGAIFDSWTWTALPSALQPVSTPTLAPAATPAPLTPTPMQTSPSATVTNTQVVLDYVTTRHSTLVSQFLSAEKSLLAARSASGSLISGNTLKADADLYVQTVQGFLNESVGYANTMNAMHPVNKTALTELLNEFRSQDNIYIASHFTGPAWGQFPASAITSIVASAKAGIDNAYDLALAFPF